MPNPAAPPNPTGDDPVTAGGTAGPRLRVAAASARPVAGEAAGQAASGPEPNSNPNPGPGSRPAEGPAAARSDWWADLGEAQSPIDRTQQFGVILSRALDLAETGLTLGAALATKVGNLAQDTLDGFWASRAAGAEPGPRRPGPSADYPYPPHPAPAPPAATPPPAAPVAEPAVYCVMNRLPLGPGEPVSVSFAVNNDSPTRAKRVQLRVEGFLGETHGQRWDATGFRVEPPAAVIAPMDFEKLVLVGATPPDLAPDIYRGRVIVTADQEFEILVRLVVAVSPGSEPTTVEHPGKPRGKPRG